jgi:tetratricopeptide (TPR) repeat protein
MPYDLFISYARRDNEQGRVTQLVERIGRDFESFAGRPLRPFFDTTEIHGMEDWRHRILQGLRESRLLLVCLSPSCLASEYCEWEFNEYLNHEVARGFVGEGVAPLYFVEVPGWQDRDFEQRWVADLRRRQIFDLRPWFNEGQEALRHADVQVRMDQLKEQVATRIRRGERAEQSLGNIDAPNPNFIGRLNKLRELRETVALRKVGVLTAVHGLGGLGKTALAIEYAHAFAHEYGGGRWQVRCEGRGNLAAAIATLSPALAVEFTDAEKRDSELQLQRVLAELHVLANAREPHRCLLLLDNVDQPKLLEPAQSQRLPAADWLHVIATTRLGESELYGSHQDRAFLSVDELPEAEALALIESFQPGGKFPGDTERIVAGEIVRLLGGFTLAVEATAAYLGQFAGDVTCAGFLARLKKDGLQGLEGAAHETTEGLRHDEKSLTATLQPTLERLNEAEKLALTFAALLPADQIALTWIRTLVAERFTELGRDSEPGHPDPWQSLLRRLFGRRLWQPTEAKDVDGELLVARMHRLLQELLKNSAGAFVETFEQELLVHLKARARFLWDGWVQHEHRWELVPLAACARQWLDREGDAGALLGSLVGVTLRKLGNFTESERLLRRSFEATHPDNPEYPTRLTNLAQVLQDTNRLAEAEPMMRRALEIDADRFGPYHRQVAADLTNLAQLLQDTNQLAEAERMMRRALAIDEHNQGPKHLDVGRDLNNLARLLKDTNRLAEAERMMRRALAIVEHNLDPKDLEVAICLNNMAQLLKVTNRLADAEPLLRQALEIHEHSYGRDHPNVAISLNNLGQLLQDTNRIADAEPMMRRALEINESSYGPNHPSVAESLTSLAGLLRAKSLPAEAEPLLRRALEIDEHSYGPDHPDVASRLNNLAALLQETKQLEEAEPMMRRALKIDERTYGPYHPKMAIRLNNLAQLLRGTNRRTEAEPLMNRVVEILLRFGAATGHEHPHLRGVIDNLTGLLAEMGLGQPQIDDRLNELGREFGISLSQR